MNPNLIPDFTTYLTQHGRSERTVRAYVSDTAHYVEFCVREYGGQSFTPAMFNRADLVDYQVQCRKKDKQAAATWNRRIASLRVFGKWLLDTGQIVVNPVDALDRAEGQKLAPRSLDISTFKRFRLAVNSAVLNARTLAAKRQALRNAAIITLLADGGLRESEVIHLRVSDVLLGERKGRVIIINAKGNKDRSIPLDKESVDIIKAWLAVRPQGGCDAMFINKRGDRLQEQGVQDVVFNACQDAHIEPITPHQLRHTFAYRLILKGASLPEVAELLGHSSIEVTRRYTLPHQEQLEALVAMI